MALTEPAMKSREKLFQVQIRGLQYRFDFVNRGSIFTLVSSAAMSDLGRMELAMKLTVLAPVDAKRFRIP